MEKDGQERYWLVIWLDLDYKSLPHLANYVVSVQHCTVKSTVFTVAFLNWMHNNPSTLFEPCDLVPLHSPRMHCLIKVGSIERPRQEVFVGKYVTELWRRISLGKRINAVEDMEPDTIDTVPVKQTGLFEGIPRMIVLCGLPGSGKSWFAEKLEKTAPNFVRISQDDLGSKQDCIHLLKTHLKVPKTRIVIDRCNPQIQDRELWKSLADYVKGIVCVYFDAAPDVCVDRIGQRLTHPTLRPDSGQSVVSSFSKQFQVPTLQEKFDSIFTVSSFADARKLLVLFGGSVSNPDSFFKYPRTRHLFDLVSFSTCRVELTMF